MLFIILLFSQLLFHYGPSDACPEHNHNKTSFNSVSNDMKLVCYYGSWAVYRPGEGKFPVDKIDPFLCTHLIYSFAGLGYDNRIKSLDPYYDLEENYGKGAFKQFTNLKKVNTNLKTLIAIGGWNEGSIKYSNMVAQPDSRKAFVASVVEFLKRHNFDGLDLDWEYPASRGGKPEDKQNHASLLRELSEAFQPHGYLLTAAVSAGKWFIDPGYDVPQLARYLDIINVMAYDYHGGWENKTGHNAPMYARPEETDLDRISNVNFSINYWISKGAPKNKIVLGMGTYGRSFTLERTNVNGYDAPAPQKGTAGPYTREAGSLGYNEICEMRMREKWTEVRDPYHLAPYMYRERQWVGYDDIESIIVKSQYIKAMNLAGGMIWSVETDDFLGKCHGETYPLLKAIKNTFKSDVVTLPVPKPPIEGVPGVPGVTSPSTTVSTSTQWSWSPSTSTLPSTSSTSSSTTSRSTTEKTSSSTTEWEWGGSSSSKPWSSTTRGSTSSTTSSTTVSSTQSPSTSTSSTSTTTKWPWAPTHPTPGRSTTTTSSSTSSSSSPPVDSPNAIVCLAAGMHRHPKDCQKFYRCVQDNTRGKFRLYEYSCPEETVFDTKSNLCTWRSQVPECAEKKPKDSRHHHVIRRNI